MLIVTCIFVSIFHALEGDSATAIHSNYISRALQWSGCVLGPWGHRVNLLLDEDKYI